LQGISHNQKTDNVNIIVKVNLIVMTILHVYHMLLFLHGFSAWLPWLRRETLQSVFTSSDASHCDVISVGLRTCFPDSRNS